MRGSFLASIMLTNTLGLMLPIATLHVFDRIIPNAAYETLFFITMGLIFGAFAEFALRRLQTRVSALASAHYGSDLRQEALSRHLWRPNPETATGVQLERLDAIDRFTAFYNGGARAALIDLPFACLALGLIWALGGWIVAAPISVIVLHFITLGFLSGDLQERLRTRSSVGVKANDFLSESFRMSQTIKSWALENLIMRRYERLLAAGTHNHREMLVLSANIERHSRFFASFATIATLVLGGWLAIEGEVTIGVVAASTLLAGRAVQPALRAAKGWSDVQRATLSAEELRHLFKEPEPATAPSRDAAPAPSVSSALAAPTIRFSAQQGPLPSGSIVAVDSAAAFARRALLEAVAGLRAAPGENPCSEIEVDGMDPREYRNLAPGAVAFVSRAPQPLGGSIIDNLTVFGRGASTSAALAIAERIGLSEDVQHLPKGFQTLLATSSADTLSPAGHVKLAVARAIALDVKLLVLDEPTVRLSKASVALLQAELTHRARAGLSSVVFATDEPALQAIATQRVRIQLREPELQLREPLP